MRSAERGSGLGRPGTGARGCGAEQAWPGRAGPGRRRPSAQRGNGLPCNDLHFADFANGLITHQLSTSTFIIIVTTIFIEIIIRTFSFLVSRFIVIMILFLIYNIKLLK